jgi:Flp pilus assembly protein TadD
MRDRSIRARRSRRIAALLSSSLAISACAGLSTPAREAAALKDHTAIAREQIEPALRLARASRAAGDFASAASLYRTVIAAEQDTGPLTVELGDTLLQAGAFDDAIAVYSSVPSPSPAHLGAMLGLMRAQIALSQPAKALESADQAIIVAPSDTRMLVGRGVALDMTGRHTEAQNSYRAALAQSPRSIAARNDLALSLALSNAFNEAIEILTPIAMSTNASPQVRQNLAFIYGLMGDDARAAELTRADLDKAAVEANLRFYDYARQTH